MPTAKGTNDGKITGVTDKMKCWDLGTGYRRPCPDGEITGLAPGRYMVWVEYTDHSFTSEMVEITVPVYAEAAMYPLTVKGGTGDYTKAAEGWTVTITATVPSGQRFTGWTVNEGGVTVPNTNPASFTMPAQAVTVTANFENIPTPPAKYPVTVKGGTGGGSYAEGDSVTITATVPDGQRFTGWTVDEGGVTVPNTNPASFTMPARAVTVTANFENIPVPTYLVTVKGGTGGGSYAEGDSVTITATVPDGQRFTGWTADEGGVTVPNTNPASFTMPAQAVTVTANFETIITPPTEYTVTFDAQGGNVAPATMKTTVGKLQSLPVPTKSSHTFEGWFTQSSGGEKITVDNVFTADTTIYAHWKYTGGNSGGGGFSGGGGSSGGGTTTTPTQKPNIEDSTGGSTTVTPVRPGEIATIRPKPDEGYEVDNITVTDKNGKPVEITKNPDGTYTFKQPNGKVMIKVTYQPIDRPWNNPFADVSEGDWYYEAVQFAQERGLMNGYSDGRFGPNDTLSRAQLAQILFNKEGRPGVDYLLDFSDVAGEAWYTEAIRWATSQGIVGGYGNGTFGPNAPITREQLAVMLWRYSGSPAATNKELHFNDESEISGFALEALRWAVENGILNGYGDGRLGPQGQATRAQVAQMLKNFIENQEANT